MFFKHVRQILLIICLTAINLSAMGAEISRGMMLSNSCAACHGTHGKSPGSIPSINGKSASFLSQALKDFRSGTRSSTVMGRHAKGYTDEEIELIAQHFSCVKP